MHEIFSCKASNQCYPPYSSAPGVVFLLRPVPKTHLGMNRTHRHASFYLFIHLHVDADALFCFSLK
jgi:hypothetical protein